MELIIILVLAFGAMWLMTNRTRKQQRKAGDFRANLEVGQEVMTGSGLYGTIVALDGDTITLESTPGNQSRWIRAAISKLVEPPVVEEATADDAGEYVADDAIDGRVAHDADGQVIDVPDDLSSMPDLRKPDLRKPDLRKDDDTDNR
jgi:preprotein translocase subunit YajC